MIDPISIGMATGGGVLGLAAAGRIIARWRLRKAIKRPTKPRGIDYPFFSALRGAHRTTQGAVLDHTKASSPGPFFEHAGVQWPARQSLSRIHFVTGKPGTGKTTLCRMTMRSMAELFDVLPDLAEKGLYPGNGHMRWCVIDPGELYLSHLDRVVPPDVPIIRASPQDRLGQSWDIKADITTDALAKELPVGLFPDALFNAASDPFWYAKAREVVERVVVVFLERESNWEFADLIVPIKYPQFLKPLLLQSPQTRGTAIHDLDGKLGRSITATTSATLNQMAVAAAQWKHAKAKFSLRDFLNRRAVLHYAFPPHLSASLSGIANALTYVLVKLGLERNEEHNSTILFGDESRYLADLAALEELAARGRGSGFGGFFLAQGLAGLIAKWGEKRVKELIDVCSSWTTFAAGPETAEAFAKHVGRVEGLAQSYSSASTLAHPSGLTSSSTQTNSFQIQSKEAVMPSEVMHLCTFGPMLGYLHGFCFQSDLGAFEFKAPLSDVLTRDHGFPAAQVESRPPSHQRLDPWRIADIVRLNLELTPEFHQALHATWGQ